MDEVSNNKRRPRMTNFSCEEKMSLLSIILKYKNIIENKKTGAVTWQQKQETWGKIEKEFVASNAMVRTRECLKNAYENIKRQGKKQAAEEKRQMNATGGGCYYPSNDPIIKLLMEIMNEKTVIGDSNQFDGDSQEVKSK